MTQAEELSEHSINVGLLSEWISLELGQGGPVHIERIKGGGSCELFSLRRDDDHWVLRRAPITAVSSTAHNVIREFRIINAMQGSDVRVPKVFAVSEDTAIAGAPFYLMEFIEGEVIRRKLPQAYVDSPETQASIGEELVDALVELHAFDWRGTYLEDIGKPENFLGRQVDRWLAQYGEYDYSPAAPRELSEILRVAEWLRRHQPASGDLTVMHGDYKLDNTMTSRGVPPRVLRIVDFEMTTVGDPLIDLAWAMIFWPEEGNLIAIAAPGSGDFAMHADYCQTPGELVQRYAEKTGRDISQFDWYQAFAAWKLAIVLEGSYAKYLSGQSRNDSHEFFGFVVDQLLIRAERFAQ